MRSDVNDSKSPNPSSQDSELSFSEKIRNCSKAIHEGKSSQPNHNRYHFLVETDDGEGVSLDQDELIIYIKAQGSLKSKKSTHLKSDSYIPTNKHHSSQKSFPFSEFLKNKFLNSIFCRILTAILLISVIILGILLCLFLLDRLWMVNKEFFTIIFGVISLVGVNVVAYFASFRWHMRKPSFFLASMFVSIIALCACLSIFFA